MWEDSLGSVNRSRNIKHLRRDPHEVWEDSLGSVNRSRYVGLFRSVLDFQGIGYRKAPVRICGRFRKDGKLAPFKCVLRTRALRCQMRIAHLSGTQNMPKGMFCISY